MAYVFCNGICGSCGKVFTFHPNLVPSKNNIPFCKECVDAANPIRKKNGLSEIKYDPKAYEAVDENEIDWG